MAKKQFKYNPLQKIKIVSNTCGHAAVVGAVYTIRQQYMNGAIPGYYLTENGAWVNETDIRPCPATRDEINKDMADLNAQVEALQAKIDFMDELNTDEYNEEEFKAFQVLKIVEGKKSMSLSAKAKAIAAIFNN
jgi:hypothetical protein